MSLAPGLCTAVRVYSLSHDLSLDVLCPVFRMLLGNQTCVDISAGVSLAYVLRYELC
jgi:hypothetical protein